MGFFHAMCSRTEKGMGAGLQAVPGSFSTRTWICFTLRECGKWNTFIWVCFLVIPIFQFVCRVFCFVLFFTQIVFPMNPTEKYLACFSQIITVWLTPCHIFKMHPPLMVPDELGTSRVDNQRVGKINFKQVWWRWVRSLIWSSFYSPGKGRWGYNYTNSCGVWGEAGVSWRRSMGKQGSKWRWVQWSF